MDKNILNREAILAADDYHREYVDMPEWGGGVYIQAISAKTGLEIAARETSDTDRTRTFIETLLVSSVVDEGGHPLFTNEDIPALMEKSRGAIDRLSNAIMKLNKIGSEDAEKN